MLDARMQKARDEKRVKKRILLLVLLARAFAFRYYSNLIEEKFFSKRCKIIIFLDFVISCCSIMTSFLFATSDRIR